MKPDVVVCFALFESVCPSTSVLVLGVLPLGTDAALEEMVVGFLCEFGGRSDVVLNEISVYCYRRVGR